MNKYITNDIDDFCQNFALNEDMASKNFVITGGTGLIGSLLICCLLTLNKGIHIFAPVRNKKKALQLLGAESESLTIIETELTNWDYDSIGSIDYIIHCAAPTDSKFFVDSPVETIHSIYDATAHILKCAQDKHIKSMVYLSSIEVYGSNTSQELITEDIQGYWNPTEVRSSYPLAKRLSENLCCSYAAEYNIPICIARLTQTTGAGIAKNDNRIIAQFVRLAVEGKDIVLHTIGESARPYCYTTDCISAILYILLRGKSGEAYNIANEETYISAHQLAERVQKLVNPNIQVRVELSGNNGYAPVSKLNLDTTKLRSLGWIPQYNIDEIIHKLAKYLLDDHHFSVCMSIYKNDFPQHFLTAIRSIWNQTLKPSEIILVVDGPIPGSIKDAIEAFSQECDKLKVYYFETNQGHAIARQKGLELASHELVAFMDSDDISMPDRFEKQIAYMVSHPETSALGGQIAEFIGTQDNQIGERIVPTTSEEVAQYLKSRCPMNMMTIMLRKSSTLAAGGFIDWYCEEDFYLWIRMILAGQQLNNLPDKLVDARVGYDMYQRRGGWRYFKSERGIQRLLLQNHLISPLRYMYNVFGRLCVQVLMPNKVRSFVFKTIFRK